MMSKLKGKALPGNVAPPQALFDTERCEVWSGDPFPHKGTPMKIMVADGIGMRKMIHFNARCDLVKGHVGLHYSPLVGWFKREEEDEPT
jgi:hypothetical protein